MPHRPIVDVAFCDKRSEIKQLSFREWVERKNGLHDILIFYYIRFWSRDKFCSIKNRIITIFVKKQNQWQQLFQKIKRRI